jgi:hypothetical protein
VIFFWHLYDACKEEIEARNRMLGIFTSTGSKNLVFKFTEKSSDKRTKKQLKDRYFQKGLYIFYGVQESCNWTWMG